MFKINTSLAGQVGLTPRLVQAVSTDSLATVTTAGYVTQNEIAPSYILPTDLIYITYNYDPASQTGTTERFTASISATGVITFTEYVSPGDVTLPVTADDLAAFDGTTGKIKDSGYSPSAAAAAGRNKLAAVQGATSINQIASFTDLLGTIGDAAAGTTVAHNGPLQSGATNGTATGRFIAASPTSAKGSFQLLAADNVGNTDTIITNAAFGQATTLTVPDPAAAAAEFLVHDNGDPITSGHLVKFFGTGGATLDAGFNLRANTTAAYGGGGTSHTFTATEVTVSSIVIGTMVTSTNDVAISKIVPGAGDMAVTFTADPGANTTISYIVISNVV